MFTGGPTYRLLLLSGWLVAFLALFFSEVGKVAADEAFSLARPLSLTGGIAEESAASQHSELEKNFYKALSLISEQRHGLAARLLTDLKKQRERSGFRNLPSFSFELLRKAAQAREQGKGSEVLYLLHHSLELSPDDPRVQIAAASFHGVLGVSRGVSHISRGLYLLLDRPVVFAAALLNVFFVGLLALTLAFLIVIVVQLIRGGEEICSRFARYLPRAKAGYLAPLLLLVVMVVPLFGGLLAALCCWALVLAWCKWGCQWLGVLSGVLLVVWGLAIPVVSAIGFHVESDVFQAVEDIDNGSFVPNGTSLIARQLGRTPSDPVVLFALGAALQLEGEYQRAEKAYQRASILSRNDQSVQAVVALNLATVFYQQKKFSEAKELLQGRLDDGDDSFEVLYNLALTHLGLLDTSKHRELYNRAKEVDSDRIAALQASQVEDARPIMASLPWSAYYSLLSRPIEIAGAAAVEAVRGKQALLASSMLLGGTPMLISGLGIISVLIGFFLKFQLGKSRVPAAAAHGAAVEQSLIWVMLPVGLLVAGDRPLPGAVVLSILIGLLIVALESPVGLYGMLPIEVPSFGRVLLGVALGCVVVSSLSSVMLWRMKTRGGVADA